MTQAEIDLLLSGAARALLYGVPLLVGWRLMRQFTWPVGVAACLGVLLGAAVALGHLRVASLIGVPLAGMNAYIYLEFMRAGKWRQRLAAKEADWSRQRHDLVNDAAAARAEAESLRHRHGG